MLKCALVKYVINEERIKLYVSYNLLIYEFILMKSLSNNI